MPPNNVPTWEESEPVEVEEAPKWEDSRPLKNEELSDIKPTAYEQMRTDSIRYYGTPSPERIGEGDILAEAGPLWMARIPAAILGDVSQKALKPVGWGMSQLLGQRKVLLPTLREPEDIRPEIVAPDKPFGGALPLSAPEHKGVVPSLSRAVDALRTPEVMGAVAFGGLSPAASKVVAGTFAATIPEGVIHAGEELIHAQTPAEFRGALTDLALLELMRRGTGHALNKGAQNAKRPTQETVPNVSREPAGAERQPASAPGVEAVPDRAEAVAEKPPVSLEGRIAELESDPGVTGQRLSHLDPLGMPVYEPTLKNARKVRELADLKAIQSQGKMGEKPPTQLTPEEAAYIEAERQAIGADVELAEPVAGEPFAPLVATIDRSRNKIVINPREFALWIRSIPKERQAQAVRSLLSEEKIHLAVDDASAGSYWDALTSLEKAITKRRYTGTWSGKKTSAGDPLSMTDTMFGHEAIRFRLQQLSKMTPREIAEAVGRERWTLKGITALESVVRGVRETLGTKASKEQLAILGRMQANLDAAKTAVGSEAGALRKQEELPPMRPGERLVLVRRKDGSVYQATYSGKSFKNIGPQGETLPMVGKLIDGPKGTMWSHGPIDIGDRIVGGREFQDVKPGAVRKGKGDVRQEKMFEAVTARGIPGEETVAAEARGVEMEVVEPKQTIFPSDIGFDQPYKQLPFRAITESEAKSAEALGDILTSDARIEGSDLPVSASKRVTVLFDKLDGSVHAVTTYAEVRGGKTMARMVDPRIAGKERPNRPVEEMLTRYKPIYSVLLREPRQNYHQQFNTLADFYTKFGEEAKVASREHGTGMTDIPVEEFPRAFAGEREPNLPAPTDAEIKSFHDFFMDELPSSADMFERKLLRAAANSNRLMISGLRKLAQKERAQTRALSEREALENVLDRLYENLKNSETRTDFVERTLAQVSATSAKAVPGSGKVGEAKLTGARELTMRDRRPPTSVAGVELPKGSPPVPKLPVQAPEMLTAAEQAALKQEVAKHHPPQFTSTLYRQLAHREVPKQPYRVGKSKSIQQEFEEPVPTEGALEMFTEAEVYSQGPNKLVPVESLAQEKKVMAKGAGNVGQLDFWKRSNQTPGAVMKRAGQVTERFVTDPAKGFARWYSGWLTDNIRRSGGPAARRMAEDADVIIDLGKELYGELAVKGLDEAKMLSGGNKPFLAGQRPSARNILATRWLNTLQHPVSKDTAVARTVDAMEGRITTLPRWVQKVVDAAKVANLNAGVMLQAVIPGFIATGKFQRIMTAFGNDLIRLGIGKEWEAFTRDQALLNLRDINNARVAAGKAHFSRGQAVAAVRGMYRRLKQELDKVAPNPNKIDTIAQDMHRMLPKTITHVRTPTGFMQVFHSDLFNYLENVSQKSAHIRAFRERFPNDKAGWADFKRMDKFLRNELPEHIVGDWDALVRTLQGHPTDTYSRFGYFAPGTGWAEVARAVNQTLVQLQAKGVLTGQMITQMPETIIAPGGIKFGIANQLRALGSLKQLWSHMEQTGAVNQLMYNFSWDTANPIRSAFRIGGNVISKAFANNFLNEFQGRLNGAIAHVAAERIGKAAAGGEPLTAWEKRMFPQTLKEMHFTPQQVRKMMAGDPELLNMMKRRAPAWLATENKHLSEGSRLGANRLFNSVFRFQMYPMMKMNQLRQTIGPLIDAWKPGGNKANRRAATESFARFMFGTTAQGSGLVALASLLYEGPQGPKIRTNEAKDNPVGFLMESFLGAMSGPLYLLWRGMQRAGVMGVGEQALRLVFPYAMAKDIGDWASSDGPYRDMSLFDRTGRFLIQKTPGLRAVRTGAAVLALSERDHNLEASLSGLGRWKRDKYGGKDTDYNLTEDEHEEFRIRMKRAVEYLKEGDRKGYIEALVEAAGESENIEVRKAIKALEAGNRDAKYVEAGQRIADSLRGRKVLKNATGAPLDALDLKELSNRIGADAVRRLQYYDIMLEAAAEGEVFEPFDK